jgi:hypothetical protein
MTFSASCRHEMDHGANVLTFTDPKAFEAHRKAEHTRETCSGKAVTASSGRLVVKMWKPPTFRAFDPQHGEVGSWVEWYGGTGQVWSILRRGAFPRVVVAGGTTYHELSVSSLRPLVQAEQLELVAS